MVLEAEKMCGRYEERANLITTASVDGNDVRRSPVTGPVWPREF
jgi:hypothetical protein